MDKIKILHLEDLATDAELVLRQLKKGDFNFELVLTSDKKSFEKALDEFHPDIILSDHSLPSFNSIEALNLVHSKKIDIPFILITATVSEEFAVDVMKRGAMDYILKDRLQRLPSAVIRALEIKENEKAIKRSEIKFKDLFESAPEAILIIDPIAGRFIEYNTNALKLLKYSGEELLSKIPGEISPLLQPDGQISTEKSRQFLQATFSGAKPVFEWMTKDATGHEFMCEVRLSKISDNHIMSSFVDITDRKNAEKKLEQQNKELIKINAELDRFVYSVSHDLRAPLSSILGVLNLAETETEDAAMIEYIQLVKKSIAKLDNFVLDILDYSRNARLDIAREKIDFKSITEDVISNLRYMNSESHVEISTHVSEDIAFYSDKRRVNIILNNLISNAIRYYSANVKSPLVEIIVSIDSKQANITVKDNGIGINPSNQPKVFDMFYRVSKKSSGSGLGLYIVRETIEKMNGSIRLESEVNKGTTFFIELPNLL